MTCDGKTKFTEWRFSKEQELENAIQQLKLELFGNCLQSKPWRL